MAFTGPAEKKARLEKTNTGALGKVMSSNVQRNRQNCYVNGDLRSLIEFNSTKTAELQAVLADEYTRDFQTGFSLEFFCNYPRLFLLINTYI